VPYGRPFYLIVDEQQRPGAVDEAVRDLAMIGLDDIAGYFGTDALGAWPAAGRELQPTARMTVGGPARRSPTGGAALNAVRGRAEWEAGHLPGVPNIPLGYLADRLEEIPRDRPVVLQCETGGRSAIAAGLLQARGIERAINLEGGIVEWSRRGNPVEREQEGREAARCNGAGALSGRLPLRFPGPPRRSQDSGTAAPGAVGARPWRPGTTAVQPRGARLEVDRSKPRPDGALAPPAASAAGDAVQHPLQPRPHLLADRGELRVVGDLELCDRVERFDHRPALLCGRTDHHVAGQ